jgi:hypothetical protein
LATGGSDCRFGNGRPDSGSAGHGKFRAVLWKMKMKIEMEMVIVMMMEIAYLLIAYLLPPLAIS